MGGAGVSAVGDGGILEGSWEEAFEGVDPVAVVLVVEGDEVSGFVGEDDAEGEFLIVFGAGFPQ